MTSNILIGFVVVMILVVGGGIFALHLVIVNSIDGAKKRLERDAEAARAREAELNRKIRQADEELAARKKELDLLEQKMKGQIEADAGKQRDELINKARAEAEEIITKAQNAAEGVRREIEKQMEMKIIDHAGRILREIFSKKSRAAFESDLAEEFIHQLGNIDMSKISPDIKTGEVVTSCGLPDETLKKIATIIRTRAGREIALQPRVSDEFLAGVVIKFGSLHLDGSIRNAIRESAVALKNEVEKNNLKRN